MADMTKYQNLKWYERLSFSIVSSTEILFYKLGKQIASFPKSTIIICLLFVGLSSLGLFRFYQEKNPVNLWVPKNSQFKHDSDWLISTVNTGFRMEMAILEGDDVLTPEVFRQLFEIDQSVRNSVTSKGIAFEDVCFLIPKMDSSLMMFLTAPVSKKKNSTNDEPDFDPSVHMKPDRYCRLVDTMDRTCFAKSILEMWDLSERRIFKLTKDDIINKVNLMKKDPVLGNLLNYEALLGDVTRNSSGHIVAARSIKSVWMTQLNFSSVNMNDIGNFAGTTEWASPEVLAWEAEFLALMESWSKKLENLKVYYSAQRSFGDISGETMFQGMDKLVIGAVIMCLYVQLVISKFNWVESRALLGGLGLFAILLALIGCCGIASLLGIAFGPLHSSLPFLLMGLGVDDMFVIIKSWDELSQLSQHSRKVPIPERVGNMMKHAGVAVTVTTATDVLAFIVGSTTVLPCMQTYCMYTAIGIFLTYMFVITFFVACFTLDQMRLEQNYNGIIPCIKHHNYKPNKFSQARISDRVFQTVYSKVILTWPGKLLVVTMTIICLGFSSESIFKLEQKFDPAWFIPTYTYLGKFIEKRNHYYPSFGSEGGLFMGSLNYSFELPNIERINKELKQSDDIIEEVVSWVDAFHNFVKTYFQKDIFEEELTDDEFNSYLSKFLFSPKGGAFQGNFQFEKPLQCGKPAPKIKMSNIDFNFKLFDGPKEHVPAMNRILALSKSGNFTTGNRFSTAWSKVFATWVTDEIIENEVVRNLELALIGVMVCTSLLIANVQICFWVFIMIILSMINVAGFMQKWGLTIDMVSCVGLQLAIGLCVDYATHIGHKFLTVSEGNRDERVVKTVTSIGSAVLYGGLSTLIGVIMLGFSEAYNFVAFFKIFMLVIIFGLFHGIVLLPVILSWVGPKPYFNHKPIVHQDLALQPMT